MEFRIRLAIFLICFSLGILYVYVITPKKRAIVKYPTPYNAGRVVYRDKMDNTCYKYKAEQVNCPATGATPQPFTLMSVNE